jgi:hypothetical protein
MEMTKRYVWLKPDGSFSNSWNEEEHKKNQDIFNENALKEAGKDKWRLIEYNCLNDSEFEFYHMMKLK